MRGAAAWMGDAPVERAHNPFVLLLDAQHTPTHAQYVNSARMHRADQTPWLTLRFTPPGWLDPCNGPHVPIGGACHPDLPDSKLCSQTAAPHLLLPPGLSSSLTSLRGRRSFVILHRVCQLAVRILPQSFFFWAWRQQCFVLTDTRLLCLHILYPLHRTSAHTYIHTNARLAIYDRITTSRC